MFVIKSMDNSINVSFNEFMYKCQLRQINSYNLERKANDKFNYEEKHEDMYHWLKIKTR